ncbi:MAG: hypothetical protein AW09_001587 [Candidatus Accumulibacter phosphatis]|uniref:Uncharacterized protein n=1 Tax=Candidatus Accumulibacter phosphatis TaxID=327160 RepID=A0A080LWT3_9PROT|nr:MAG: hypothetical protein AW09_001587 [Candidatus Accumulibacter phosphatis]
MQGQRLGVALASQQRRHRIQAAAQQVLLGQGVGNVRAGCGQRSQQTFHQHVVIRLWNQFQSRLVQQRGEGQDLETGIQAGDPFRVRLGQADLGQLSNLVIGNPGQRCGWADPEPLQDLVFAPGVERVAQHPQAAHLARLLPGVAQRRREAALCGFDDRREGSVGDGLAGQGFAQVGTTEQSALR